MAEFNYSGNKGCMMRSSLSLNITCQSYMSNVHVASGVDLGIESTMNNKTISLKIITNQQGTTLHNLVNNKWIITSMRLKDMNWQAKSQKKKSNYELQHKPLLHTHSTNSPHSCTDWPRKTRLWRRSETHGHREWLRGQVGRHLKGPCWWRLVWRFTSLSRCCPLALTNTASHWRFVARGKIRRRSRPNVRRVPFSRTGLVLSRQCELASYWHTAHVYSCQRPVLL